MAANSHREAIYSVLQYLDRHNLGEAARTNNRDEAHTILHEELSTFLLYNPNLIERGTEIMNLENFRTYEGLQEYGEPVMARTLEMMDVRRCLEGQSLLSGKIRYRIPNASGGRGPADLVLPSSATSSSSGSFSSRARASAPYSVTLWTGPFHACSTRVHIIRRLNI
ncbi:hypothetical protein GBA52_001006 [Prunus armeniaca]|nr:hypothetical protein GBA52_001006 [Prunus armeniaca]